MANYVRRLVSGDKSRFKDANLNLELDLIYLTDQIIIMGYPAAGIEGLYRNRREDTKKFLDHRHGKNYWVYNFCPIRENTYDPSFFEGRVSRYPYPDHHAPPLAIMPLLAREMRAWLKGSLERVAVLHCKAGKGRSGTMACTYLLSLDDSPSPPRLERSYTAKQWAKIRTENVLNTVPEKLDDSTVTEPTSLTPVSEINEINGAPEQVDDPKAALPTSAGSNSKPFTESLKDVLDLHTSRRMKAPSSPGKKTKQGVSIPSQRRWLYYWALLLAHEAPAHIWNIPKSPGSPSKKPMNPRVKLTQITLRMKESSGMKINLVRAANIVIGQTNMGKNPTPATGNGYGHVWVSLARYDDDFVEVLENWEKHTRDERHMGWRKPSTEHLGDDELDKIFEDGKWDKGKMVRSFARLGPMGHDAVVKQETEKDGKILTYTLRPLTDRKWNEFRDELQHGNTKDTLDPEEADVPASEANSMYDLTQSVSSKGVVLDAGREVRVKLYMGQVFMGWIWFIPSFHMQQSSSTSNEQTTKMLLTRKEVDFPLGIGSGIIDVEISLEWLKETDLEIVQPPARVDSKEEASQGTASEPSGIAAVHATTAGNLSSLVEAKQAAKD